MLICPKRLFAARLLATLVGQQIHVTNEPRLLGTLIGAICMCPNAFPTRIGYSSEEPEQTTPARLFAARLLATLVGQQRYVTNEPRLLDTLIGAI